MPIRLSLDGEIRFLVLLMGKFCLAMLNNALHLVYLKVLVNFPQALHQESRPFPSCFEPHYESEAKYKVFVMKISFHSYANKTNFHIKSFALSLAFIVRFTATWKWSVQFGCK